jgi:hypothetical protein
MLGIMKHAGVDLRLARIGAAAAAILFALLTVAPPAIAAESDVLPVLGDTDTTEALGRLGAHGLVAALPPVPVPLTPRLDARYSDGTDRFPVCRASDRRIPTRAPPRA